MYEDWKLHDAIGEGGQAQVFRASRQGDEKHYALKRFKNSKREERSNTEILNMQNLWALGIPVPQIIDTGEYKEGRPYFVTPYFSQGNLDHVLEQDKEDFDRISFSQKLCLEIRKMNKLGYVHRDLKPANILLDDNLNPVICDFGLSNSVEKSTGHSRTGEPIGSTHYMHPQAFDTKSVSTTFHIGFDGYSFAKILYKILTGKQLYGFTQILDASDFSKQIKNEYIAKRVMLTLNRLLTYDIEKLANYWNKFPKELEIAFLPPSAPIEISDEIASRIRDYYQTRLTTQVEPSLHDNKDTEELIEEIESAIENCPIISFINEVMEHNGASERVRIDRECNLRELLEGVGAKSHYGIAPLTERGRKKTSVLKEMLVIPPMADLKIGISILTHSSQVSILLCLIRSKNEWIDIEKSSIQKIVVERDSHLEKRQLEKINHYLMNKLGEYNGTNY